jgi:GDP-4-dehydro-6-deoxy-D-mannose reductase
LLVTGASGFVGGHLRAAVESGVFGEYQMVETAPGFDIRQASQCDELIAKSRPDAVIHLAAQSFVPRSFEDPRETFDINLMGTLNLLGSLRAQGFKGRLLYISSGDVYGLVSDGDLPVDERRMPEPRNPYAASKFAAEQLCLQWHRSSGLDAIVARPFNHAGPGQDARFVLPALAQQVVAIASGQTAPVIRAGDIDITRDFSDVRDVVAAYSALMRRGVAGRCYVVGSGKETKVRDLLRAMCELRNVEATVEQDVAKLRPSEQRRMCADISLIRADTGWEPSIPIAQTLADILNFAEENR